MSKAESDALRNPSKGGMPKEAAEAMKSGKVTAAGEKYGTPAGN